MIKVLCCKAFRCVLLRKSAVLSTSLQSLYMALVDGKRHVLKTKNRISFKVREQRFKRLNQTAGEKFIRKERENLLELS